MHQMEITKPRLHWVNAWLSTKPSPSEAQLSNTDADLGGDGFQVSSVSNSPQLAFDIDAHRQTHLHFLGMKTTALGTSHPFARSL